MRAEVRGGHPDHREGHIFDSLYLIRDVALEIKLPSGVRIDPESKRWATAHDRCFANEPIGCKDVYLNKVRLDWNWNMWSRCSS